MISKDETRSMGECMTTNLDDGIGLYKYLQQQATAYVCAIYIYRGLRHCNSL